MGVNPSPKRQQFSLRLLQAVCLLSAIVALAGGGTFVMLGVDGVARVTGTEYPELVQTLEAASASIEASVRATFDMHYRALGWYWVMTGVMLLWITPNVQHRTDWFRFIHVAFMAVGVASLITISESGTNAHARYGAVAFEIGIPATLIVWQTFVARAFSGDA